MKYRIGLDLDGVVANFNGRIVSEFNKRGYDIDSPEGITDYYYHKCVEGLSQEECWRIIDEVTQNDGFWESLHSIYPCIVHARKLCREHHVYVITSRRELSSNPSRIRDTLSQTRNWLFRVGLDVAGVIIVDGHSKKEMIETLNLEYMIDDNPYTFEELRDHSGVYLRDAPYNQHIDTERRIYGVKDYREKINGL